MNLCMQCKSDFSSVGAFDAHQTMTRDNEGVICNTSVKYPRGHAHAGKPVLEQKGSRNGGPYFKFADHGQFAWRDSLPVPSTVDPDATRECKACGGEMRKSKPGRGRWPSRCVADGGTGVLVTAGR